MTVAVLPIINRERLLRMMLSPPHHLRESPVVVQDKQKGLEAAPSLLILHDELREGKTREMSVFRNSSSMVTPDLVITHNCYLCENLASPSHLE